MPRQIFRANLIPIFLFLTFASCHAQTLSNCRPAPPLPPNAKPGVGGLALSHDGKTLVVAGGDGKVRFLDMATGEVRRILRSHKRDLSWRLQPGREASGFFESRSHGENLGRRLGSR